MFVSLNCCLLFAKFMFYVISGPIYGIGWLIVYGIKLIGLKCSKDCLCGHFMQISTKVQNFSNSERVLELPTQISIPSSELFPVRSSENGDVRVNIRY